MNEDKLKLYYFRVTDLWKRFCEEHSSLYDLTCDEYSLLLNSELDALDEKVKEKEENIARINALEHMRAELISTINNELTNEDKISDAGDLLKYMSKCELETTQKHLYKFNELLIDIITRIQEQNKKNQLFLNKAIHSLQSIRDEASGRPNYTTYDSNGSTRPSKGGV